MDGTVGWVPALGPSGWQGVEVFSEVLRWNRAEVDTQMKTPSPTANARNVRFASSDDLCYT